MKRPLKPPLVFLPSPVSLVLALPKGKLAFPKSSSQIELIGIVFSCFLHCFPTRRLTMSACVHVTAAISEPLFASPQMCTSTADQHSHSDLP